MTILKHTVLPLISLFFITACDSPQSRQAEEEAIDKLKESTGAFHETLAQQVEEGGISDTKEINERYLQSVEDIKKSAPEAMQEPLAVSQAFMKKCMEDSAEFEKVMPNLTEGVDYSDVKEPGDLDVKSDLIRTYEKANATFKDKINNEWKSYATTLVQKSAMKPQDKKQMEREFTLALSKKNKHLNSIRDADAELCEIILKQHKILKENFQSWEFNPETLELTFEEGEAVDAYNALAEQVQDVADRQLEAQKKLLPTQ